MSYHVPAAQFSSCELNPPIRVGLGPVVLLCHGSVYSPEWGRAVFSIAMPRKLSTSTENELAVTDPREYKLTTLLEDESPSDEYILLGRTYMDDRNYKAVEG